MSKQWGGSRQNAGRPRVRFRTGGVGQTYDVQFLNDDGKSLHFTWELTAVTSDTLVFFDKKRNASFVLERVADETS